LKSPAGGFVVVMRAQDPGAERDVAGELEPVRHMIEVAQDLRLRRVLLGPLPVLLELGGERVGVRQTLHVAAGAGVAVPEPGAADAVGCLDDARAQAELAQPVELVQPGEAGSDDDGVIGLAVWRLAVWHLGQAPSSLRCWFSRSVT